MPITIGRKAAPKPLDTDTALARKLGEPRLKYYQAEAIDNALNVGKEHYLTHFLDPYGKIACPSGDENGPCLHRFGVGFWFDPGLGKTATFLIYDREVRKFLREQGDPRASWPSLIATTNSAKWQVAASEIPLWREDLRPIGKVMVIDGDSSTREAQLSIVLEVNPEIIVIHHAQVSLANIFDFVSTLHFLGLYTDEDQYFKNWSAQRTKMKNGIHRCFQCSISGTPESGYADKLHPILHSISPGSYVEIEEPPCQPGPKCPLPQHARYRFFSEKSCRGCYNWSRENNVCTKGAHLPTDYELGIHHAYSQSGVFGKFSDFIRKYCWLDSGRVTGSRNERELHHLIYDGKYAYRVTTDMVYGERNIPIIPIMLDMKEEPKQQELYATLQMGLRKYFDEEMEEAVARGSSFILAQFTHLRRATTVSPAGMMLAYGNHPPKWAVLSQFKPAGESVKIKWALSFIQDNVLETSNKIIIGSEWTDCLEDLKGKLESLGIRPAPVSLIEGDNVTEMSFKMNGTQGVYYATIDGSVPAKQRFAIRGAFNADPRLKILLVTQAGYTALDLTGGLKSGDTMYITCLGVPWLPDMLRQLFGWSDRVNMEGKIAVYLPACRNSIDEFIHSVLYGKALSAQMIVDGNFDDDEVAARLSLRDAKTIHNMLGG